MRLIKLIVIMSVIFNITVCNASAEKVFCDVVKEDSVASVYVLADENGTDMSESDIMVFISDEVKKITESKIETVILTITDGIANEENIAKIIDGIDVICVNGNSENKKNCVIEGTTVVYSDKGNEVIQVNEKETNKRNESPVEMLFSKLAMCGVLIIAATAILVVVKRKQRK